MLSPLRLKRLERGFSQYVLSFMTGVSTVKICYAEKGYPTLNEKQKVAIAEVLGAKPEEIFPETK